MLTLIAMERPTTLSDDDIRDEKVKVLRQIKPAVLDNTVVGQYEGYLLEANVPQDSLTPTFASCVLFIDNERWDKVPFILKAGKALEQSVMEIRLQLRSIPGSLFSNCMDDCCDDIDDQLRVGCVPQNEIVIKLQPREAIYMKVMSNKPGVIGPQRLEQTELDFSVRDRFSVERMPDAYERLIYDVIAGNKQNFVRSDELREAWRIFTPLLDRLTGVTPEIYAIGSRGPTTADRLAATHGYKHNSGYSWVGKPSAASEDNEYRSDVKLQS